MKKSIAISVYKRNKDIFRENNECNVINFYSIFYVKII